MAQPGSQLAIVAGGLLKDKTVQRFATLQQIDHVLAFPTTLADDDQARRCISQTLDQLPPQLEQQPMVLARLNRPQHYKIRRIQQRGGNRLRQPGGCEQCHRSLWHGSGTCLGISRKLGQRCRRIGYYALSRGKHGVHPKPVAFGLSGAAIFRMRHRNEIVNKIQRL